MPSPSRSSDCQCSVTAPQLRICDSTSSTTPWKHFRSITSVEHCSTWASVRRNSTVPIEASRTATTPRWTCAWTSDEQWTASDIVNGYDEITLAQIIRRHGDERFAGRIARAIVAARPIETTTRLAEVVVGAIPAAARRTGGHPAKRTFQAIRIELNHELEVLPDSAGQRDGRARAVGGRIAVLSYHSGEDRIVKERMRLAATGGCVCPPELPCVCEAVQTVRIVRNVPRTPTADEQAANPRRAALVCRVVERIEPASRNDSMGRA